MPHWKETFAESLHRLCRDGVDAALADLLLQKNGYRVLRFLNEDVCSRLDAILDSISLLISSA